MRDPQDHDELFRQSLEARRLGQDSPIIFKAAQQDSNGVLNFLSSDQNVKASIQAYGEFSNVAIIKCGADRRLKCSLHCATSLIRNDSRAFLQSFCRVIEQLIPSDDPKILKKHIQSGKSVLRLSEFRSHEGRRLIRFPYLLSDGHHWSWQYVKFSYDDAPYNRRIPHYGLDTENEELSVSHLVRPIHGSSLNAFVRPSGPNYKEPPFIFDTMNVPFELIAKNYDGDHSRVSSFINALFAVSQRDDSRSDEDILFDLYKYLWHGSYSSYSENLYLPFAAPGYPTFAPVKLGVFKV